MKHASYIGRMRKRNININIPRRACALKFFHYEHIAHVALAIIFWISRRSSHECTYILFFCTLFCCCRAFVRLVTCVHFSTLVCFLRRLICFCLMLFFIIQARFVVSPDKVSDDCGVFFRLRWRFLTNSINFWRFEVF